MDYEKKYEEALERAKAGKPMDEVFPELRESEDERIRKELVAYIKTHPAAPEGHIEQSVLSSWLAYLEKQKEQKPTNSEKPKEWSEEDEKMLTGIIERGSSQVPFGEPALREEQMEWLMNMLKFHSPQPKPAEWSEEDKKYLNLAINIVASDLGEDSPTVSWLKYLRPQPHWKPSAPQMRALREAVDEWDGFAGQPTLESLYNDLKKLM